MNDYIISGGISGAITDPYSFEAQDHAEMYYEEIRHRIDDIEKISKNTGYDPIIIKFIKEYLFEDTHKIGDIEKRFDESFQIAESWQRLADMPEYIQEHDKVLLLHEIKEISLICEGKSQKEAHNIANEEYNYALESAKFYKNLEMDGKIYKIKELKNIDTPTLRNDYDDLEL